jgi:predicted ATPase
MSNENLNLKNNKFLPYISRIVFPQFKNIALGSEINFESAITILTGANGSGKSSILHALYGCPKDYNIGKFWFSTKFDDINQKDCFFYEYNDEKNQVQQVLIKRSPRPDDPKYKHKGNTNYWETSRPLIGLGMQGTKNRAPQISKEVQYIDFRANLTAFDKFMYFKNFTNSKGFTDLKKKADYKKQNKLINRSNLLNEEIETGIGKLKRKERIGINNKQILSKEQCQIISNILKKDYDSIEIIWHKYFSYQDPFDDYSPTIILKEKYSYSDAYAGSGESSIILLIYKLINASNNSLILLDEPETSIHPEAQKKLIEELIKITISKSLQVIICTHSEHIISNFDHRSIRTFYKNPDKSYSMRPCSRELALNEIGIDDKFNIYVEDKLSEEITRRSQGDNPPNLIRCEGAANMLSHHLPNAFFVQIFYKASSTAKHIFILDGDQKKDPNNPDDTNIEELLKKELNSIAPNELEKIILRILKNPKNFKTITASWGEQKEEKMKEFFLFLQKSLKFLPDDDPESFILNNLDRQKITKEELEIIDNDSLKNKSKFEKITKQRLQKKEVNSAEIFFIQKEYLTKINEAKLTEFKNYIN